MEEGAVGAPPWGVCHEAAAECGEAAAKEDRLYQKIGQLEVELDWLKKKSEELNG
jgi:hypothetical protein